jgi:hypothetical protein
VLCCVVQEFNPLVYSHSQQSQSSLSELPHGRWSSNEGRQQLHDYQLQQQQPQVFISSGVGSIRPQAKPVGGGSTAGTSRLDSQVCFCNRAWFNWVISYNYLLLTACCYGDILLCAASYRLHTDQGVCHEKHVHVLQQCVVQLLDFVVLRTT